MAALYRGDFLAGFFVRNSPSFEEWALVVRQRLHQQVLEALDQLAADPPPAERWCDEGELDLR